MSANNAYSLACNVAVRGRYEEALQRYSELEATTDDARLKALITNDRAVIAAVCGEVEAARALFLVSVRSGLVGDVAERNLAMLDGDRSAAVQQEGRGECPTRVAILSLLFNWPSTGGGTIHTKELAEFLGRAGYAVRHLYARCDRFGVGNVAERLPYDSEALDFRDGEWTADTIRSRFREAVAAFSPDWVIVTDSWSTKPLLCEAAHEYPYFIRIAALECLCPLNNVRLLVGPAGEAVQCPLDQLSAPAQCRLCVSENGGMSGGLHQAERVLAGFDRRDYAGRLQAAFRDAAGVLVVNPFIAELVRPHARAVHVIPSGFDKRRFPATVAARARRAGERTRIVFAGLVHEFMKGFRILETAGERLWERRQDFEIVATADPPGRVNEFLRFIGWQSQSELPQAMTDADIVVFPTVAQEALGRSAVEAMGCGRPVVASRIGGLPWVVDEGLTGLLFEPGNVADLCDTLERLLDDTELRERMGRAGREKFERQFTWDVVLQQYQGAFKTPLVAQPKG
jgi:glycosyltransferase involved in cell wall biosynthesis